MEALLARVVVGAVQKERHTSHVPRDQLGPNRGPSVARSIDIRGQIRAKLVTAAREVMQEHPLAIRGDPPSGVARWESPSAVSAPYDDRRAAEAAGERWQRCRVAEGIRAIEHGG